MTDTVDVTGTIQKLRQRLLTTSVEISSIIGRGIGRTIATAVAAVTSIPGREINQLLATTVEVAATIVKFPIIGRIYKIAITSAAKTKTAITSAMRTKLGW